MRVSWALDQRLVPLIGSSAVDSLVRAAFELGNPISPVMGVDWGRTQEQIQDLPLVCQGKVVLTAVIKAFSGSSHQHCNIWAALVCEQNFVFVTDLCTA